MMQNVRMKKSELFQLLDSLRIDRNEFWVVSSGALVLRGILDDAGDLDIVVTKKGLEELTKNYNIIKKGVDKYFVQENIESVAVVEKEDVPYPLVQIDGYFVQNIKEYYDYLLSSSREKDKARLPLVKEYMKKVEN